MPLITGGGNTPTTGDFSGTLNGLSIGSGTFYKLVGMTGWHDIASAPLGGAGSLSPRTQASGSWPMPYYVPERVLTLLLAVEAPVASFEDAVLSLAAATTPQVDSTGAPVQIPVVLQIAGVAYTVYGSVSNRQIPTTAPDYSTGYSLATVEVTCPDPRKFGDPVSVPTGLPSVTGGLTLPATVPWTLTGTQSSGSVSMTNPGDTNGPITLRIYGPVTAPTVTHVESGASLTLAANLTVSDGDWLDIDCEARTVLYNGQASRNGALTSRGWFAFEPGVNTIGFNAAAYNTSAAVQVTGTPAWL
ncbi:MAG TPA: hypothetical protein VFH56_00265 [Acidimicrobiales bacterium]|nr:hypothetical protein [Acidimicrobiales bacterium]